MSKVRVQTLSSDQVRNLPIFLELAEIAERIRDRAYKFYEDRGFVGGREIEDWLMADTPFGDPDDLPPAPDYSGKWLLGEPDLVVGLEENFVIPADVPRA